MEEAKVKKEIEASTRTPGWYNIFFWWCAGVNRDVLRQCPTEWAKYAGMGGTIFSTACMAALSGGYAISTVFDSTIVAVLFGWGSFILSFLFGAYGFIGFIGLFFPGFMLNSKDSNIRKHAYIQLAIMIIGIIATFLVLFR